MPTATPEQRRQEKHPAPEHPEKETRPDRPLDRPMKLKNSLWVRLFIAYGSRGTILFADSTGYTGKMVDLGLLVDINGPCGANVLARFAPVAYGFIDTHSFADFHPQPIGDGIQCADGAKQVAVGAAPFGKNAQYQYKTEVYQAGCTQKKGQISLGKCRTEKPWYCAKVAVTATETADPDRRGDEIDRHVSVPEIG